MQDSTKQRQNAPFSTDLSNTEGEFSRVKLPSASGNDSDSQIHIFHSIDAIFNSSSENSPKTASNGHVECLAVENVKSGFLCEDSELLTSKNRANVSQARLQRKSSLKAAQREQIEPNTGAQEEIDKKRAAIKRYASHAHVREEIVRKNVKVGEFTPQAQTQEKSTPSQVQDKENGSDKVENPLKAYALHHERHSSNANASDSSQESKEGASIPMDAQDDPRLIRTREESKEDASISKDVQDDTRLIRARGKHNDTLNGNGENFGIESKCSKEPQEAFINERATNSASTPNIEKSSAKIASNRVKTQTDDHSSKSESQPALDSNANPEKSSTYATVKDCRESRKSAEDVKNFQIEEQSQPISLKEIVQIPISSIIPNPNQPRKCFDEPSILKLADSINQFGIIQPLTVRKEGQCYELIAGERRLRAAMELEWTSVPCIIANVDEVQSAEISIIENLLRENLNIFEQAQAIEVLIDTYGLTQEQVATKLSSSQSYVANKLRLLRLSPSERLLIVENKLSERHARAILRINDPKTRQSVLKKAINDNMNVSETEILVQEYISENCKSSSDGRSKRHAFKDISAFSNTILRAIDAAKSCNFGIKSRKIVGESFTEITIILPNTPAKTDEFQKSTSEEAT